MEVFKMSQHECSFRVYYEDTDAAKVMYHASYLRFAERARTEWLRSRDFEQSTLMDKEGLVFPVYKLTIDYIKSAKLDDLLTLKLDVVEIKKVRMKVLQKIYRQYELIAKLEVDIACCDLHGRAKKIPQNLV
jgi:acyl-CoA thioester hydrolase